MALKTLLVTKIGKNYGALLQAYALRKSLEECGCCVSILNYSLPNTMQTYKPLPKIKGRRSLINWINSLQRLSATEVSIEKFLEFRTEYFNFTKEYLCYEDLKRDPPVAELYVVGSDQVWNPYISFDKAYYLLFGDKSIKRASYAASIGVSEINDNFKEDFINRIACVEYKSVREKDAQRLLMSYGIYAEVHIDPTLLLTSEQYDEIAIQPNFGEKYVLLYLLILPEDYKKYVNEVRNIYPDAVIVNIPGKTSSPAIGDIEMGDIGPKEFLGLIKNAEAVVTSSFHGTVFSIIYKKQFMSIIPHDTGKRISDLLDRFGLNNRITKEAIDISAINNKIHYDKVTEKLNISREQAKKYLQKITNGNENKL